MYQYLWSTFRALAVAFSLVVLAQTQMINAQSIASSVHVDDVSVVDSGQIVNATVSNSRGTYQLTCNQNQKLCKSPMVGSSYAFKEIDGEKPADLLDLDGQYPKLGKTVLLNSRNSTFGRYWEVAHIPLASTVEVHKLLRECLAKESSLNVDDCAKWIAKREWALAAGCPNADSSAACQSLKTLLSGGDSDLIYDFATKEHIYVCLHPHQDSLVVVSIPEPSTNGWRKPTAEERKLMNLIDGTLIQLGGPDAQYYDDGQSNQNNEISEVGYWTYFPSTFSGASDAEFNGKKIKVDAEHLTATEQYKAKSEKQVDHVLNLQRSNGRFKETYTETVSGREVLNYSGRCLIVPSATD